MNVVVKVGSLISQGVYSVATPFHPFGGAVDVIVVQQQDGTFRSTPWYVQFGKFQGVLKGAEKLVRISVNGVEADFHMYLDNSGEAYFIREVDSGKTGEANGNIEDNPDDSSFHDGTIDNRIDVGRLEHSVSDSGVTLLRDDCASSATDRLQRAESDGDQRFYDFQEDQSSLDGLVELSDYGSNRYGSLHGGNCQESQGSDSEVILVSVDGHILTAPVSASEQSTENVQLTTPQFHLGPGDGAGFCEGSGEFSSSENTWDDGYISKLNSSTADVDSVRSMNDGGIASSHQLEVCKEVQEHTCQSHETENIAMKIGDPNLHTESTDIKKEVVFKSCLELTELPKQVGNADTKEMDTPLNVQNSQDQSLENHLVVNETEDASVACTIDDGFSPSSISDSPANNRSRNLQVEGHLVENTVADSGRIDHASESIDSVITYPELKNEQFGTSAAVEGIDNSSERPVPKDECSKSEIVEPPRTTSGEGNLSGIWFEISLCGNELRTGMGLDAAAEAFDSHRISEDEFRCNAASITKNENLVVRFKERYFLWEKAAPFVLGMAAFGLELPVDPKDAVPVEQKDTQKFKDDESGITSTPSGRRWRLWPIPFRRVKTLEHTSSNLSSEEAFVDTESGSVNLQETSAPDGNVESPHKQFIRTNVPTNEQIASLNLKDGQNMITFSFSTRVLGKQQVDAHIYLWKWNARIVISDVDGTITKSDVLGQFMPLVGKDWTQSGVAKLFSAIKENGYQLLFLSARAIVQAYLTRSFLLNLKQDGKALPNGPVVISPDGLFPSLYREVIRRAPHEFKIACLEDIKKLFPSDYNPFYAGFGNRDTDELSYKKIGIPKGKIFIINPKGEVAISHRIDVKSYTSLHTLINDMFPPTSLLEQEDYNSWNFWKVPMPEI
ncbi:phosphatidate phosphatase PAH1-like isoform X2 [Mangifera indica]|uniref:phosphatidate phosphatase PAH1-like isoform X2 n=1 Tax=Mangifera indica TaxID=29780 RepID=UPI001CFA8997|nr:phosphatidate phosphatase PAH1-like isoform X2 [Mangifera indica]